MLLSFCVSCVDNAGPAFTANLLIFWKSGVHTLIAFAAQGFELHCVSSVEVLVDDQANEYQDTD